MRARVSVNTVKRLEALEQKLGKHRSVAMLPRLVSVDEWSNLASQMQAILKDNIKKDVAPDYGELPKLELVVRF